VKTKPVGHLPAPLRTFLEAHAWALSFTAPACVLSLILIVSLRFTSLHNASAKLLALGLIGCIPVMWLVLLGFDRFMGGGGDKTEADHCEADKAPAEKPAAVAAHKTTAEKPAPTTTTISPETPRHAPATRFECLVAQPKRMVALLAVVMLVCWSFWIVGFFPGIVQVDSFNQIIEWYEDSHPLSTHVGDAGTEWVTNRFTDHHPIFDTLIFGLFACGSDALFGSWTPGIFAYCLLQAIATAGVFSLSLTYLARRGLPAKGCIALMAFYCLVPAIPIYAFAMLKDPLFSWIYVPYFLIVVEAVRTRGAVLERRSVLASLLALSVLLALTKKLGIYVVVPSNLLLIFACRAQWKRLVAAAALPALAIFVVIPLVVYPLADVAPGNKKESLSLMFIQTSRYVLKHGDEVTDEERAAIDRVLVYDTLADHYRMNSADRVKEGTRLNLTSDDIDAYAKVWVRQGLKHPLTYLAAWAGLASNYVALGSTIDVYTELCNFNGSFGMTDKTQIPPSLAGVREGLVGLYGTLLSLPPLAAICNIALYSFWLPVLCLGALRRHAPALAWVMVPTLISCVGTMVSPILTARYALPLIYTVPLLVAFTWCTCHGRVGSRELPMV